MTKKVFSFFRKNGKIRVTHQLPHRVMPTLMTPLSLNARECVPVHCKVLYSFVRSEVSYE